LQIDELALVLGDVFPERDIQQCREIAEEMAEGSVGKSKRQLVTMKEVFMKQVVVQEVLCCGVFPLSEGDEPDDEFVEVLENNPEIRLSDILTMTDEEWISNYNYDMIPAYRNKINALNYWLTHPAKGEAFKPRHERFKNLTYESP